MNGISRSSSSSSLGRRCQPSEGNRAVALSHCALEGNRAVALSEGPRHVTDIVEKRTLVPNGRVYGAVNRWVFTGPSIDGFAVARAAKHSLGIPEFCLGPRGETSRVHESVYTSSGICPCTRFDYSIYHRRQRRTRRIIYLDRCILSFLLLLQPAAPYALSGRP